jgi:hypothetical protein
MAVHEPSIALEKLFAAHPELLGAALPPLPESGRCGICGELIPDPDNAPRGEHVVLPPDVTIAILLCATHAEER